jgi:hypothetical protein
MKFNLEIELNNEALTNNGIQLAAALRGVANRIDFNRSYGVGKSGEVFDVRGSTVGKWQVTAPAPGAAVKPDKPQVATKALCPKCGSSEITIRVDAYANYPMDGFDADGEPVADFDTPDVATFDDRDYVCDGCDFESHDSADFEPHEYENGDSKEYQVVVGNIGTVYDGPDVIQATLHYENYVKQSKSGYGKASSEPVTLMQDGEPIREHVPQVIDPSTWHTPSKATLAEAAERTRIGNTPTDEDPELCECGRPWDECATRDGEEMHDDR